MPVQGDHRGVWPSTERLGCGLGLASFTLVQKGNSNDIMRIIRPATAFNLASRSGIFDYCYLVRNYPVKRKLSVA